MSTNIPKVKLTKEELEAHFRKQIGFLQRSADAFDAGFIDEATRIAQVLRILFHDNRHSHSLLGQLGMKNIKIMDTSPPIVGSNELPEMSLVHAGVGGMDGQAFVAPLSNVPEIREIPAENWWNQTVLKNRDSHVFSRSRLIRTMADQDGGAHVDPSIDGEYREIAEGAFGFKFLTDGRSVEPNDITVVTVRQIAHEVLASLVCNYRPARRKLNVEIMTAGCALTKGGWPPKKHPPNLQCPCSSGLKYKKCHGRPPLKR